MRVKSTKSVNEMGDDDEVNARREHTTYMQTPKFPHISRYV
jgi:hypothetical protein